MPRALVWLRSDLRTEDHSPFSRAAAACDSTIAVFLLSPGQWRQHDWAACKVDFVLRNLRELSVALARLNIPLLIATAERFCDAPATLLAMAREHRCDRLFFNNEYEVNESRRDEAVQTTFERAGLAVDRSDDQVVMQPGSVRTADDRPYTVFTPYKRAWLGRLTDRGVPSPVAAPICQRETGVTASPVPDRLAGFDSAIDPALWPAGESAAQFRLSSFIEDHIPRYKSNRNTPALSSTSLLSPYLTLGIISPRQCLHAAVAANHGRLDSPRPGPTTWISELIWREFYKHLLVAFPRLSMGRAFKPATDRLPWRDDQAEFAAWCEGRTGFPVVDAAMRQLNTTGWMHNRLRMIAAMFLAKDLFIDWRSGERYFMQRLVDGDLASNNGGWQWSASTGTDAAPYFRIFNPFSQSRACDPRGEFIRRFVPELAHLDDDSIHEPHTLPPLVRDGLRYPEPIVDHAKARERVLAAFSALRP